MTRTLQQAESPDEGLAKAEWLLIAWLAMLLLVLAGAAGVMGVPEIGDATQSRRVSVESETLPAEAAADGLAGHGILKATNESGSVVNLRLVGPAAIDSRTVLIRPWRDVRVMNLAPGLWTIRYCTVSACAELEQPLRFSEKVEDENFSYRVAFMRFGPSPHERPTGHAISHEEFVSE